MSIVIEINKILLYIVQAFIPKFILIIKPYHLILYKWALFALF